MKPYLTHEHPIRMAHRGSRLLWPENTMPAFQGAVDLGYRYIETDVRASADGVLFAFHDRHLERLTDASGRFAARSAADLARLDAAYHFRAGSGYPWRGGGIHIPTLDEVLNTFPGVLFNLDVKADDTVALLAAFVVERGLEDRVLIGSFHDHRLRRFRRLTAARVATSAGPAEAGALWAASRAGFGLRTAADAYQLPDRHRGLAPVDASLVAAAHAAGKHVHVWTVNEAVEMHRFLDLGVDGLITDRPDVLNDVIAERSTHG